VKEHVGRVELCGIRFDLLCFLTVCVEMRPTSRRARVIKRKSSLGPHPIRLLVATNQDVGSSNLSGRDIVAGPFGDRGQVNVLGTSHSQNQRVSDTPLS